MKALLFTVPGGEDKGGVRGGGVFMTPRDWPTGEGNLINSSSLEHCQTSPFLHLP